MKRLWLGIALIALTSGGLLISDWGQRKARAGHVPRVAFAQYASQQLIEDAIQGMKEALSEAGYTDPGSISIEYFNSQNDAGTAAAIAKQMSTGGYDLLVTMSTLSLQSVSNANQDGRTRHVFGLVSDPAGAGVGISRTNPLDHPKHLAGIGTMQPVENAFRVARQMYPRLKKVGVAWNAAESNSAANLVVARRVGKQMGIELIEANVENSAAVTEASQSLIARGAEALWIGADLTVLVAMDTVIRSGQRARIPVFTSLPDGAKRGALFDLGANYFEVGREQGKLIADVLKGTDPATVPVRDVMVEKLYVNSVALKNLKDPWQIPEELVARAALVVDENGIHEKESLSSSRPVTKKWKIRAVQLNNAAEVEEVEEGVREGFREEKLVEDKDYEMRVGNAQGDMPTLNGLIDNVLSSDADLLLTYSSPTLQTALRKVENIPVVFTYVSSGIAAGAGRTREDHRPNFTGVDMLGPYAEMMAVIKEFFPSIHRIGTLHAPAEVNMVISKTMYEDAAKKAGLEVVAVPVNSSTDVLDAALALTSRKIDAICQIQGNLPAVSFGGILQAANKAKLPLFAFTGPQAKAGAAVSVARDYVESGRMTAHLLARVMRGENPRSIPLQTVTAKKLLVNLDGARAGGIKIPDALVKRADEVIGK
jgi:ABC-type uncharacterized transport system substrate-binding protein